MATEANQGGSFEDFITYTICLETFKEPKYLPWGVFSARHSSVIGREGRGFRCPVCRKQLSDFDFIGKKIPGPTSDQIIISWFQCWTNERFQKSEKLCNACNFNDDNVKAISWCSICEEALCDHCEKYHRSFKMTAKHSIISFTDIRENDSSKHLKTFL